MRAGCGGARPAVASVPGQAHSFGVAVYLIPLDLLLCVRSPARPCLRGSASSWALCAERERSCWKVLKDAGTPQALSPLLWERKGVGVTEEMEKGQRAWGMARKPQKARKNLVISILFCSTLLSLLSLPALVARAVSLVQLAVRMMSHRRLNYECFSLVNTIQGSLAKKRQLVVDLLPKSLSCCRRGQRLPGCSIPPSQGPSSWLLR